MKSLSLFFTAIFFSLASFAQTGVYVYGDLINSPGYPVDIVTTVYTNPPVTATLTANESGQIETMWIDLPSDDWTLIDFVFPNCQGQTSSQAYQNFPTDSIIDFYIALDFCENLEILGCTDPEAINYDPTALLDDGSCLYDTTCTDVSVALIGPFVDGVSWALYHNGIQMEDGTYSANDTLTTFCLDDGCYEMVFFPANGSQYEVYHHLQIDGYEASIGVTNNNVLYFGVNEDCGTTLYGCTDPVAINYNPNANIDDGSCEYDTTCNLNAVTVLITPGAWAGEISWNLVHDNVEVAGGGNYNSTQTIQYDLCLEDGCYVFEMFDAFGDGWNGGTFFIFTDSDTLAYGTLESGTYGAVNFGINSDDCDVTEDVYGCTNPDAINYNPEATIDDGSCEFESTCTEVMLTIDGAPGIEGNWYLYNDNGLIESSFYSGAGSTFSLCLEDGCYDLAVSNFGTDSLSQVFYSLSTDSALITSGVFFQQTNMITFGIGEGCDGEVYGCTNPSAINYNPQATIDDGSCEFGEPAENDWCADATPLLLGTQLIDNSNAVNNENIWGECWAFGSGEGEQSSIWFTFTTPDFPASIHIEASGDGTYSLTDTQFGLFEECGGEMIYCDGNSGQGLFSAFNFNCGELAEGTTYILMVDGYYGDAGTCNLTYTVTDGCQDFYGCTDPAAINYNPEATIDDGSCQYQDTCDFNAVTVLINTGIWAGEVSWNLIHDSLTVASGGNYNSNNQMVYHNLCLEDGCYTFEMFDTFGDGWNGGAFYIIIDGDTIADGTLNSGNYGAITFGINSDDCNVTEDIYGCTDPEAINYNPQATIDDGSCEFETSCTEVMLVLDGASNIQGNWYLYDENNMIHDGFYGGSDATYFFCLEDGCFDLLFTSFGLDSLAEVHYTLFVDNEILNGGTFYDQTSLVSFGLNADCGDQVLGCTDPNAINYNPLATEDDGSCEYNSTCDANEVLITLNTGLWGNEITWYLLDADSTVVVLGNNYESNTSTTYDLCLEDGCYSLELYDSFGDGWNGGEIIVSMNGIILTSGTIGNSNYNQIIFGINTEDCGESEDIYGCTDPAAINYNPQATIDDGSCEYQDSCLTNTVELIISTGNFGSEVGWSLLLDSTVVADGSGYGSMTTYSEMLCLEDGCYTFEMYDSFGDGWNGGTFSVLLNGYVVTYGTLENGNYGTVTFGINTDDCNATEDIYGCTDPNADNYNPSATIDDGSCEYTFTCAISFTVSPDTTGAQVIWITPSSNIFSATSVLWDFGDGNTSTSLFPVHTYAGDGPYELCLTATFVNSDGSSCTITHCAILTDEMINPPGMQTQGFSINVIDPSGTTGVEENLLEASVSLYPNPARNQVNLTYELAQSSTLQISLFDSSGKCVLVNSVEGTQGSNRELISVESLTPGLYLVHLSGSNISTTVRLVKK